MQKPIYTGLLGYGLGHSFSADLHEKAAEMTGIALNYLVFDIPPEELESAVRGLKSLGFAGCNVTIPYKEKILRFVDELGPEAGRIGAVNTLVIRDGRILGENTDWRGFKEDWQNRQMGSLQGADVVVLGAGGAAGAVLYGLAEIGVKHAAVFSRSVEKAEKLAQRFNGIVRGFLTDAFSLADFKSLSSAVLKADALINATPAGMFPKEDESPVFEGLKIKKGLRCYDLIYNPLKTKFLERMESQGAVTAGGLGMLVGQGAASFEMWTGLLPSVAEMNRWAETAVKNKFSGGC